MPAQLVALTEGPDLLLDKPIVLVGRHPECDFQIESRKISRRHCCVAQLSEYLIVRDLGSTNGIRINGVRVLEGRLKSGDELTIGGHRYRVAWDADSDQDNEARPDKAGHPQRGIEVVADQEVNSEESSDEPIALIEPQNGQRVAPHDLPKAKRVQKDPGGPPIIPEQINLAPMSDADLRPPTQRPNPV